MSVAIRSGHRRPSSKILLPEPLDMGPTPERAAKSVFTRGKPPKVLSTLDALFNAGDIDDAQVAAAERWHRDYRLGVDGHFEPREDFEDTSGITHDRISWGCVCARAMGRVRDVEDHLGQATTLRIVMMLAHEMSFSRMGSILFPSLSLDKARSKVSAQCALALDQLANYYRRRAAAAKQNACAPDPVSANK